MCIRDRPGGGRVPLEQIASSGATSFYNALSAALVLARPSERPQLVVGLSDGLDNMSFLNARHVASIAKSSGATLYVLLAGARPGERFLVSSATPYGGGPDRDHLKEATAATGGALFEMPAGTALPAAFKHALDDFRTGYVLQFTPRGVAAGGWHDLSVRTKDRKLTVRARKGYEG